MFLSHALYAQEDTTAFHSFTSDQIEIRYLDQGEGEPVVLLHGFASSAHSWTNNGVVAALHQTGFRTIAYDARGHGKSDKPHHQDQYGFVEIEDLNNLLDHLNISKAHIVGYSRGASMALGFRTSYPSRVKSLVLGGFCYDGESSGKIEMLYKDPDIADALSNGNILPLVRLMNPSDSPMPDPQSMAALEHYLLVLNDPKALAAAIRADGKIPKPSVDQLQSNTIPTIAVMGEQDALFTDCIHDMARTMNKLELLTIPMANHMETMERPELITGVLGFLSKFSP